MAQIISISQKKTPEYLCENNKVTCELKVSYIMVGYILYLYAKLETFSSPLIKIASSFLFSFSNEYFQGTINISKI